MPTIQKLGQFLESEAPHCLAEEWDNVGLLVGDPHAEAKRVMCCLTVTPESAAEAIDDHVDLIVSHHPLPFRPVKRLTTETVPSRMLWDLIRAGVAIYSPHTAFDSATQGINQMIGERLKLELLSSLRENLADHRAAGTGRFGSLVTPCPIDDWLEQVKTEFGLASIRWVGSDDHEVRRVGIACGSGGSLLSDALQHQCDTFITGEATFHTCLEARANRMALVLLGHYQSERFAIERLAERIQKTFSDVAVWASRWETDPMRQS